MTLNPNRSRLLTCETVQSVCACGSLRHDACLLCIVQLFLMCKNAACIVQAVALLLHWKVASSAFPHCATEGAVAMCLPIVSREVEDSQQGFAQVFTGIGRVGLLPAGRCELIDEQGSHAILQRICMPSQNPIVTTDAPLNGRTSAGSSLLACLFSRPCLTRHARLHCIGCIISVSIPQTQ